MSSEPGDNGDDIDDDIRDLIDKLDELTDLLRFAITGGQGPPEEGEGGPEDLWEVGTTSKMVDSVSEFKNWRRKSATSQEVAIPSFRSGVFDSVAEKMEVNVDLFVEGYRNLGELFTVMSRDDFDMFVREYAKEVFRVSEGGEPAIAEELLDILEPDASFFGITYVGARGEEEVNVVAAYTPFNFVDAYGEYWHLTADPTDTLGLEEDPNAEIILGEKSISEVNRSMAKAIFRNRKMDLPEEYADLLPPGMRSEYFE